MTSLKHPLSSSTFDCGLCFNSGRTRWQTSSHRHFVVASFRSFTNVYDVFFRRVLLFQLKMLTEVGTNQSWFKTAFVAIFQLTQDCLAVESRRPTNTLQKRASRSAIPGPPLQVRLYHHHATESLCTPHSVRNPATVRYSTCFSLQTHTPPIWDLPAGALASPPKRGSPEWLKIRTCRRCSAAAVTLFHPFTEAWRWIHVFCSCDLVLDPMTYMRTWPDPDHYACQK